MKVDSVKGLSSRDYTFIAAENHNFRSLKNNATPTTGKTAIHHARVFDGFTLSPPDTIIIDGGIIWRSQENYSDVVNHVYAEQWRAVAGLDRRSRSSVQYFGHARDDSVWRDDNAVRWLTHGNIVTAVDGNDNRLIHNPSEVAQWLEDALAWGPAFVKVVAETPGLSQKTINILTETSHQKQKRVACHAADYISYVQAATAGRQYPTLTTR
ncbi:hypothetical protein GGR57DRAFT_499543 [Xylariaceae sp. FL1272]|nr:hypothetical protein GGR57DRAFT_499543 [Xylariaceae sp. FL1272]